MRAIESSDFGGALIYDFFFYFPCSLLFFGLFFRRYIYTNVLYSFPTSDVISDDRVLRLKKLICLCDRKFEYEFGR